MQAQSGLCISTSMTPIPRRSSVIWDTVYNPISSFDGDGNVVEQWLGRVTAEDLRPALEAISG